MPTPDQIRVHGNPTEPWYRRHPRLDQRWGWVDEQRLNRAGRLTQWLERMRLAETHPLTDATPLFKAAGVDLSPPWAPDTIAIHEAPETYSYEPVPENNWLFSTIKGFQELHQRLKQAQIAKTGVYYSPRFATVGTGNGLDVIAAWHTLHPRKWIATDLNPHSLKVAQTNLDNILKPQDLEWWDTRHELLQGSLAEPLIEGGHTVDILYGNLPTLPAAQVELTNSIASSTFIERDHLAKVPEAFDRYRLATQYTLLQQAHDCVAPGGSVVLALGGRVPYEIVGEMFETCGYRLEDLYGRMRVQTQPRDVVAGYAAAEKEHGTTFSFYNLSRDGEGFEFAPGTGLAQNQKTLADQAISAQEALRRLNKGHTIGNTVWILRGVRPT